MTKELKDHSNNNFNYDLKLSFKRRSVSITISPDCSVKVLAPRFLSKRKIDEIVQEKSLWIKEKLEVFAQKQVLKQKNQKKYIDGESFYYLGDEFQLKIVNSNKNQIEFDEKNLVLWLKNGANPQIVLNKFFSHNAKIFFYQRLEICHKIFNEIHKCNLPKLTVRKMKSRYGSMHAKKGKMALNQFLLHCPISLIDYVIMHELCHIKHQDHSKKFYALFSQVMFDWKLHRKQLKEFFDKNLF